MAKTNTVTKEVIERVRVLLSTGSSQHEAARVCGISQFSVNNIKNGYYDSGKLCRPKVKDIYDYSFF